jgi:hypothetical protein
MSWYQSPLWDLQSDIISCRNVPVCNLRSCDCEAPSLTKRRVCQIQSQSYFTTDSQSVSMSWCRAPLWGPWPDFTFFFCFAGKLLCSSSCCALSDERTSLQIVVQSVSGQSRGGLISIHYSLIWDYCVPFPSPLTTRRDYGGSILTLLHTDRTGLSSQVKSSYITTDGQSASLSWCQAPLRTRDQFFFLSWIIFRQ